MALKEIKTETEHYFEDEFGNKQGEYKRWYSDGQIWVHCYYVDGNSHGEYKEWWYDNGQLFQHCFYVDDNLHGEFKRWHLNGQLSRHCFFVDGKRHGEFKSWYSDGQLDIHCFYVDKKVVIDFVTDPDEYPTSAEAKTYFALKYGWSKWL
jgi:antitoxin component YwqK of YwqJK toxin-antitoxin module